MSSGYQKFSSRFARDVDKPKTFASFATFAGGGQNFDPHPNTEKAEGDPPKIQSAPVKVAQVAKVEPSEAVCAVSGAGQDLWHVDTPTGAILVHKACARFLPQPKPAEPSAVYRSVTAEPDGALCKVQIAELPPGGGRYSKVFAFLLLKPPAHVPVERWRRCIEDSKRFLSRWAESAEALGWTSADLFALAPIPKRPRRSYNRLSRYDRLGLCWALQGRRVTALTADSATIRNPTTGNITVFRKNNRPAYGPVGDSLEDFV